MSLLCQFRSSGEQIAGRIRSASKLLRKCYESLGGRGQEEGGGRSDCSTGVTPVKREGKKDFSGRASHCTTALSKCPGSRGESRFSCSHHHESIPEKVQPGVSSEVAISPRSSLKGLSSHVLPQQPQLCFQGQKDESSQSHSVNDFLIDHNLL